MMIRDSWKHVNANAIVSCLQGHRNIVRYVDHLISRSRSGIYEYSLLTMYYKSSVLQLMNDRLMSGRCLSAKEILGIFCDMCEAVARLHHSQTPVIHRDLKVENILIDDRDRSSPPRYVLCDFGSATTKVLSLETHSRQFIEDEILRYTTLSYRAPEMIDIYAGRPIGTKSDIWAMGVLLYKLCYFTLPFGESSLAIQNCSYVFPSEPEYPDELRAIIKMLLQTDIDKRPDIYQVCCLAFEAAGKTSPAGNLNKVRRIPLSEALELLGKDTSSFEASQQGPVKIEEKPVLNENAYVTGISTTVNPRLRPKPSVNVLRNAKILNVAGVEPSVSTTRPQGYIVRQNSMSSPDIGLAINAASRDTTNHEGSTHLVSFADARLFGFKDLEDSGAKTEPQEFLNPELSYIQDSKKIADQYPLLQLTTHDSMSMHLSAPQLYPDNNRSNTFPVIFDVKPSAIGGLLRSSAFKPYSETSGKIHISSKRANRLNIDSSEENFPSAKDVSFELVAITSKWNPFMGAPFEGAVSTYIKKNYDGQENSDKATVFVDKADPFGAAPFGGIPSSHSSIKSHSDNQMVVTNKDSDQNKVGNDQADIAKVVLKGIRKQNQYPTDFEYFRRKREKNYRDSEKVEFREEENKEDSASDWSSEENKSDSSSCENKMLSKVPSANKGSSATEVTSSGTAFPLISASSSTAPLLSSSSFSLKSTATPATSSPPKGTFNLYEGDFSRDHALVEPIILHETNPFVNLDTIQSRGESGPTFVTFPAQSCDYSFTSSIPYSHNLLSSSSQPYEQQKSSAMPFAADQNRSPQRPDNRSLKKDFEAHHFPPASAKKLNTQSPSSSRYRLPSAGSSHSSDDSPQIEESGDKMLLKDARSKSSHGGISNSRRKKLSHMDQYAANRALQNESLSLVDACSSAKHSPALKKHSRKHSGQSVFKRSGPAQLDAASFVNTSFQAEDWESRSISPTRRVLPQRS